MKLTPSQKSSMRAVLAQMQATNCFQTEAKAWLKSSDPKTLARNKDHIARMLRYCELMARGKIKRNNLRDYFLWQLSEASKKASKTKDKMSLSDNDKALLGWAFFAELIGAGYNPIQGKPQALKGMHALDEIKKGKSNLANYRDWFQKRERVETKPISLTMDEVEDSFADSTGC